MKKIFTLLTLVFAISSGFAQNADTKSYDDLMRQSRRARTTSTILVATGPVVAVGGIGTLIYGLIKNEEGNFDYYYDLNGNYVAGASKKYTTEIIVGATATLVGLGMALSSIAFTNKAFDLKREARKTKLKTSTERISIPGFQNGFASNSARQFKLSLMIPIGR